MTTPHPENNDDALQQEATDDNSVDVFAMRRQLQIKSRFHSDTRDEVADIA